MMTQINLYSSITAVEYLLQLYLQNPMNMKSINNHILTTIISIDKQQTGGEYAKGEKIPLLRCPHEIIKIIYDDSECGCLA